MKNKAVHRLTYLSILSALLLLMAFTPLGYLRAGPVAITFLTIPVVVAAVTLGPSGGAVLGGMFGLSSFLQCFGLDVFGTTLLGVNFFLTLVLCFVPRILMGWLTGVIFAALRKRGTRGILPFAVSSLAGSWLNTILFVGALVLFFGRSDYLRSFGDSLPAVLASLITLNTVIESAACLLLGTAISRAVYSLPFLRQAAKEAQS